MLLATNHNQTIISAWNINPQHNQTIVRAR
jgi:hypothetical protein